MDIDLLSLLDRLESVSDADELKRFAISEAGQMGFSTIACVKVPGPGETIPDTVLLNSRPEQWAQRYVEERQFTHDPVVDELRLTDSPFTWSDVLRKRTLKREDREVVESAGDFGMRSGFVVPIYNANGYVALVSYTSDQHDPPLKFRQMASIFGVYVHAKLRQFQQKAQEHKRLSRRERECMHWVAMSKTDDEIADIIGLSSGTVHQYIESAKRKLGARDRMYAVIQALRRQEIAL